MIEHRKHTRLGLMIKVEVKTADGQTLAGMSQNISFGGMLIKLADQERIKAGDLITLSLIMQEDKDERMAIEFECRVVHVGEAGAGIQFIAMDIAYYQHFKNMMVFNSPDPDLILEELHRNPGLLVTCDTG